MRKNKLIWFKNWNSQNIKHLIRVKRIFHKFSRFQKIEIYKSNLFGKILTLDNEIQICEKFNSYVHESLIHPVVLSMEKIKEVLVIGGGDGFSLGELIKYPYIQRIDLVEIDKDVVNICRKYFPEVKKYFNDKRVRLYFNDGFDYVKDTHNKYDLIVLDISDPKNFALKIFSKEFILNLKRIMKEKSAIVTHCESPDSAGEVYYRIIQTYKSVFKIVRPYRIWIPHYVDFWGRLIASDIVDPLKFSEKDIEIKIKTLKINLKWLNSMLFYSIFRSFSNDILENLNKNWGVIHERDKYLFSKL
ncbi:MAG: hypothetical protein QW117_03195 [Candidatus Pacearchaeota archaeon]